MNEALIKELIKYKLNGASKIINHLPPVVSEEIRGLGKTVLKAINENLKEIEKQSPEKSKPGNKLDNIIIE